ncbi:MAG: hypothetical protein FJ288_19875 [Planctomycetes bacterium]|nr:hypothetical protein [Planctomycetota bacterium]
MLSCRETRGPPLAALVPLAAAALILLTQPAAALTIDTFSYGTLSLTQASVGSTSASESSLTDVIGGTRAATLTVTYREYGDATAIVLTSPGILTWDEDDAIKGTLLLDYTGSYVADFTDGGTTSGIVVKFTSDNHPWDLRIDVYEGANQSKYEATIAAVNGAGVVFAPYVGFVPVTTGVDFTKIDHVKFLFSSDFDAAKGADLSFDLVQTGVSEPLTMAGLLMGVGSVGCYIRRRRLA